MKNFKAVSMPCTEEQAKEMVEICKKHGIYIVTKYNSYNNFLVNNFRDDIGIIGFCKNRYRPVAPRTVIPYNPIEFIKACGVEVEPKWEKLTKGGIKVKEVLEIGGRLAVWGINEKIELSGENSIYWFCKLNGRTFGSTGLDLVPYNPHKELLSKKEQLEKELEQINKELGE